MSAYFAEFVGTFVLVFAGCGSVVLAGDRIGAAGISVAFGLSLLATFYTIGHAASGPRSSWAAGLSHSSGCLSSPRSQAWCLAAVVYRGFAVPKLTAKEAEQALPSEQAQRLKGRATRA